MAVTGLTDSSTSGYEDFITWLAIYLLQRYDNQEATRRLNQINENNWRDSAYYRTWNNEGSPTAEEVQSSMGEETPVLTDEQKLEQLYSTPATTSQEAASKFWAIYEYGQNAVDVWLQNAPDEAVLLFRGISFPRTEDGLIQVGESYYSLDDIGYPYKVNVAPQTEQPVVTEVYRDNSGKAVGALLSDGTYIGSDDLPITYEEIQSIINTNNAAIASGEASNPQQTPQIQNTPGYEWTWDGNEWVETRVEQTPASIPEGYIFDPNSGLYIDSGGNYFVWNNGQMVPASTPTDPNALTPNQQEQLNIQREQMALQAQELKMYADQMAKENQLKEAQMAMEYAQYLADLASNPAAFLTYAAATGQPGVVQNFMPELLYGENANLQAGDVLPGWEGPNYQTGYSQWGGQTQAGQGNTQGGQGGPSPTAGQRTAGPGWTGPRSGPSTSQSLSQITQGVEGASSNMGPVAESWQYSPEGAYPGKEFYVTPDAYYSTGGNFPVNYASGTLGYDAYVAMARAREAGINANEAEWLKAANAALYGGSHWLLDAFLQYSPGTYTGYGQTPSINMVTGQQETAVNPFAEPPPETTQTAQPTAQPATSQQDYAYNPQGDPYYDPMSDPMNWGAISSGTYGNW